MRISFGARVNLALIAGLALLCLVTFFAYRSIEQLVETGRAEARAFEDIAMIERIVANLGSAETALRRFLATGSRGDFSEYNSIGSLVFVEIDLLRGKTGDARQKQRLERLKKLAEERFEFFAQALAAAPAAGLHGAAAAIEDRRNAETAQRTRRVIEEFTEHEWRTLRQRQGDTTYSAGTASFMIAWGGLFAATLLLWAIVIINRYHATRRAAEAALRASESQMRLVTDAMPALIACVDAEGRFHFHNQAFERWFGIAPQDFERRSLRQVFGEETYATLQPHLGAALSGAQAHFNFTFQAPQGAPLDLAANLVPRRDDEGKVTGFYLLVTDITELKRLERMQAEFVSTVSHELRTPLTSIRGSLGLLAGGGVGALPHAAKDLIDIARNNCERLVRLVNDILDAEKIETGKMSFSLKVLDLAELAEQSASANGGFAAAHGVSVRIGEMSRGARVLADGDRLNQVMANLLSNACKFTPPGSVVEVAVARRDGMVRVSVSDRGPGISEAFRARIFERFSQADSSSVRDRGGTGLGLAISRAIVGRLGGRIGFEPREGGGTTFFFELPESSE